MKEITQRLLAPNGSGPRRPFALYRQGDCVENARAWLVNDSIDLIITDPPYGIQGDRLDKHYNRNESFVIDGYVEIPEAEYEAFSLRWVREAERVLRPGGAMYLVSGWTNLRHILNALAATDLTVVNHIIWKYNFGVFTRAKYVSSHYHILYCAKAYEKPTFNTYSRYSASAKTAEKRSVLYADMEDVWIIDREYKTGKIRHKNELPTTLLTKMIQYSSNEGDVIADFFAGSFSTAKVAKALNRSSVSFEIMKAACEHQAPLVVKVAWGEKLDDLLTGIDDRPANQLKPWPEDDLKRLADAYRVYRAEGKTKQAAIDALCIDFGRGRFSILNALKRQGL